jgi:UDP-N-acetylglucosamine transferase subunit ALG13
MSFVLGCTAKSLTPLGAPPKGAVSPLGLPTGLGIGTFMEDNKLQSLVRVIAIVLSSAELSSLLLLGKYRAVMLDE